MNSCLESFPNDIRFQIDTPIFKKTQKLKNFFLKVDEIESFSDVNITNERY